MPLKAHPFLMFEGNAEEAMNFYVGLFTGGKIVEITKHVQGEPGVPGSVKRAVFEIKGQRVMCIDSAVKHGFTFTPAFSFFIECDSEDELRALTEALSQNGTTLMPLNAYGFSKLFAWVSDRFGVSWQLNLA